MSPKKGFVVSALLSLAFFTSARVVLGAPDGTSVVKCAKNVVYVNVQLAEGCSVEPKAAGSPISSLFSVFNFSAGGGQTIGGVNPPDPTAEATLFTFNILAGPTSGRVQLVSDLGTTPVPIDIIDKPDTTSVLSCPGILLDVNSKMTCTIDPKKSGTAIWTDSSVFVVSASPVADIIFSAVTPNIGSQFQFTLSAQSTSARTIISDGISSTHPQLTIIDVPDATSSFDCGQAEIQAGSPIQCKVVAQKKNVVIFAKPDIFQFSGGNPGTSFSPIRGVESSWQTTVVFGSQTGNFELADGVSPSIKVAIWATADGSSQLVCSDTTVARGGAISCVITARSGGAAIYARPGQFKPTAKDLQTGKILVGIGSVLPVNVNPTFTFSFTPDLDGGQQTISISDGVSAQAATVTTVDIGVPDASSVLTCASDRVPKGESILCSINAKAKNIDQWSKASSFVMSDNKGGGTFSTLAPDVSKQFSVKYTAPNTVGQVTLADGVSKGFVLTVTDAVTAAPTSSPTAAPVTGSPTTTSPTVAPVPPKKSDYIIPLVAAGGASILLVVAAYCWCKRRQEPTNENERLLRE